MSLLPSVLAPFLARSSMEAMLQENVTWPVSWTLLRASRSFVLPPSPHLPSGAITPDPDAAWECRLDAVGTQLPSFCRQTLSQGLPFTAASCPLPSRGTWRYQASHCSSFSCCRAQALGARASAVEAHSLNSCGSWALEHRLPFERPPQSSSAPRHSSMSFGHCSHRATPCLVGRPPVVPYPACKMPYSLYQCWPTEFSALMEIVYLRCPTWRPPASMAAKLSTMEELIFKFSFINFHGSTGPVATLMNRADLCNLLSTYSTMGTVLSSQARPPQPLIMPYPHLTSQTLCPSLILLFPFSICPG